MTRRRENSGGFSVESTKSPHVLDLRPDTVKIKSQVAKVKKSIKTARNLNSATEAPLSKDSLFKELEIIESRDAILATRFNIPQELVFKEPNFKPQLIAKKNVFVKRGVNGYPRNSEENRRFSPLPRGRLREGGGIEGLRGDNSRRGDSLHIRNFAIAAGAIAFLLFGIFFVQKGLALKDKGIGRGIEAYENFLAAEKSLSLMDFNSAEKDFSKAYENLASVEESLEDIGNITISIVENIPFETKVESSLALLKSSKHVARSGEILSSAFTFLPLNDAMSPAAYLAVLIGGKDSEKAGYLVDVLRAFHEKLEYAKEELTQANYYIKDVDSKDFPQEFQKSIGSLSQKIPILLNIIEIAKEYANISMILLGEQKPMRYLVLFQNSSELRPTGGFIGTYAILEVSNGKLQDLSVDGIYQRDGQLTVNVIPPEPFQHIATGWSTHDANWFLDFPTSAEKISWFYEKTGGGKVDGVITLNIELIEKLFAITGDIPIDEYDLVLNAENFRDEIQYEVEVAYDKGLNRPKKIISDFTPIFLEKLSRAALEKNKEILSVITDSLEQKYVMFYFKDPKVQEFFENQDWSGNVKENTGDYLAVVHSNIGGYKTDKFMEDEVKYSVEIKDDGSLIGNVEIKRTHNGGGSKYWWYNRNNIDYVKIYVPEGSRVIDSSGGARRKAKNPVDYSALNFYTDPHISSMESSMNYKGTIDIFKETGKTVFATWLITNPKDTTEFSLRYELPFKVDFNNNAAKYNLYMQKQPGTKMKSFVSVDYPNDWEVIWSKSQDNFEKSFILDIDTVLGYIFKE